MGNITREVETRELPSKQKVSDFSVATNRFYTESSGEKKQETEFHQIVCFGKLAERALKKHSNIGDIILEPFSGSGSTMMACEQLGRKCYAIELDPKFVDVAIKRYEKATGTKAIKL